MQTLSKTDAQAMLSELRKMRQENLQMQQALAQILDHIKMEEKDTYTAREVLEFFGMPSHGQRVRKVHQWYRQGHLNTLHGHNPRLYDGQEVRALKEAWLKGQIKLL